MSSTVSVRCSPSSGNCDLVGGSRSSGTSQGAGSVVGRSRHNYSSTENLLIDQHGAHPCPVCVDADHCAIEISVQEYIRSISMRFIKLFITRPIGGSGSG